MTVSDPRPPIAGGWWNVLLAWTFEPLVVLSLALAAGLYLIGVRRVRARRGRGVWPPSRSTCFFAGIVVVFVALASPLDRYADSRLSVHMVQHLLLAMVAPPLLLLGRPVSLAHAATSRKTRAALGALTRSRTVRLAGSPMIGFAVFAIVLWVSHFSSLYEIALANDRVHALEHVLYVSAALLFWWPIVAKDPGAARLSHPARAFYLFLSMPVMSLLGFAISSSRGVLYPPYVASTGSVAAALADQRLAGTIMWESSMLASVVALSVVLVDWMRREEVEARRADGRRGHPGAPGPVAEIRTGGRS